MSSEKRLSERVLKLWESLRSDGEALPKISKLDSNSILEDWKSCIKVKVSIRNSKPVFEYEDIGQSIEALIGKEIKGVEISSGLNNVPGARILTRVALLLPELKIPMSDHGEFLDVNEKPVMYRSSVLPFADDEGKLSHLVIALSWKKE